MYDSNLEKNIFKVWLIISIIISIILTILSFITYTYLTGFLLGISISLIIFYLNNILLGKLFVSKKTFKFGFLISLIKTLLTSCLWVGILVSVIFINKTLNNNNGIDGVFNFFTVFVGFLIYPISIIFYHFLNAVIIKNKK